MAIAELHETESPNATPTDPPSNTRLRAIAPPRLVCSHCLVAIPAGEVAPHGFCRVCLESEGPPVDPARELVAVALCRTGGLRAVASPCGHPKCPPCRDLVAAAKMAVHVDRTVNARERHLGGFNDFDAEMLKRYFSRPPPTGIGGAGGFGAMIERIGESTNYKSKLEHTRDQRVRMTHGCPICAEKAKARQKKAATSKTRIGVTVADMVRLLEDRESAVDSDGELALLSPVIVNDEIEAHVARMTPSHDHSRKDREAVRPIRTYEKEIGGRIVQVQVLPPTLDPISGENELMATNETQGCGRYGSWDEQATDQASEAWSRAQVRLALESLPTGLYEVLEAHYGSGEERAAKGLVIGEYAAVAVMTPTAIRMRKQRARDGILDTLEVEMTVYDDDGKIKTHRRALTGAPSERGLLLDLDEKSTSSKVAADVRKSARVALEQIRTEAVELVRLAQGAYATAGTDE